MYDKLTTALALACICQGAIAAENSAGQVQTGENHISEIYQTGTGLSANSGQSGTGHYVQVYQTGIDSDAAITQTGQDNWARVYQASSWGNSHTNVEQDGTGNLASIDQRGDVLWVDASQLGEANTLYVQQSGYLNSLHAVQEGDGNFADVTQLWASTALVLQRGTDNFALIHQLSPSGTLSGLSVTQDGVDNQATINQGGDDMGASIYLDQIGVSNNALIEQGGHSLITFAQVGNSNHVDIGQSGISMGIGGTTKGNLNEVTVTQEGWDSGISIDQTGDGNIITATQNGGFGAPLSAEINQSGNLNEAALLQVSAPMSGGQMASLLQSGTGNLATVTQQ
ncbi:hypothetical protein [Stutzerimonas azotifigens]|uniref:hypothetical protein n=1 Tax=Stutzerimonas azotifigens TaxID=291995 RepID=UPI000427A46F|nr:hypothetical protein [Stutzerimonas azotifigens]